MSLFTDKLLELMNRGYDIKFHLDELRCEIVVECTKNLKTVTARYCDDILFDLGAEGHNREFIMTTILIEMEHRWRDKFGAKWME